MATQLDLLEWAKNRPTATIIDVRALILRRAFSGATNFDKKPVPAKVIDFQIKRGAA